MSIQETLDKTVERIVGFQQNIRDKDAYNAVEVALMMLTGCEPNFRDE